MNLGAVVLLFSSLSISAQPLKHLFFDFKQDSLKSRMTQVSMPTQGQTAGISNSLATRLCGKHPFEYQHSNYCFQKGHFFGHS